MWLQISSGRVDRGEGRVSSITNLDSTSLQWVRISLKRTLSFLDCGIREWIRDSREDEALADIESAQRFGVSSESNAAP